MSADEKDLLLMKFYRTVELAQKAIEAELGRWPKDNNAEAFDSFLFYIVELSIKLLRVSWSNRFTSLHPHDSSDT